MSNDKQIITKIIEAINMVAENQQQLGNNEDGVPQMIAYAVADAMTELAQEISMRFDVTL